MRNKMLLTNIMSNYLSENTTSSLESFSPVKVKKTDWQFEQSKALKSYDFNSTKKLEYFVVEVLKYIRESSAKIEVRFLSNKVGIIIHSRSSQVAEIEIEASKDLDKICRDIDYYYAE